MPFVLKQRRTFKHSFHFYWKDGSEQASAEIVAEYEAMPRALLLKKMAAELKTVRSQDEALLNIVLVDVLGIDVQDPEGNPLEAAGLVAAAKQDPMLSQALCREYREAIEGNDSPAI